MIDSRFASDGERILYGIVGSVSGTIYASLRSSSHINATVADLEDPCSEQ